MAKTAHYQTLNPTNGQIVKSFPSMSDAEVSAALTKAHQTYLNDWRHRPVSERCAIMLKAAKLMRSRKAELAALGTLEMGKVITGMEDEVELSASIIEYYATHGEEFLKTVPLPGVPGAVVASEPVGVILAVEPWNFPYYQVARVAGPQLVAGNPVLLKHASSVPQCALAIEKLFADAGVPAGVYTNLFCTIPQINLLIEDFRVRGVTLTGSERAGASVAELAGRHLKKVVLELGGSDPLIVLEDAPLDEAIQVAAMGRLYCMGQACAGTKRYIVVGKQRGQLFLEGVRKIFASLHVGDASDPSTTLGPLFAESGLRDLLRLVEEAKAAGAMIAYGGKQIDRPGFYLEPTIITNISRENPFFMKETFGPVASLYVVDTEEEAIEIANATTFGLGASLYSSNIEHAKKIATQIESGMVFINSAINGGPNVPFGGVKNSGFGRELGELGIQEFLNKKMVRVHEKYL